MPKIASVLECSVDALLGYQYSLEVSYEDKYRNADFYWGLAPNSLCLEIMRLRPPIKEYRVLDIGCGEGKDAVFLAKNGYDVYAYDISETGLEKARNLAQKNDVSVKFFKADLNDYELDSTFDIIFSSGTLHYVKLTHRKEFIDNLKKNTSINGINVMNVFVDKPFIEVAPDDEIKGVGNWCSGELFMYYSDWMFHRNDEVIFECNSGGIPHQHCKDVLIAEKIVV